MKGIRSETFYSDYTNFRWISVNEKLPEYDESIRVFAYTKDHDFNGQKFFHLKATDLYPDAIGESLGEIAECVTHWCYEAFPK